MTTTHSHVFRGGSWGHAPRFVRATYRCARHPFSADNSLGFRLALLTRAVTVRGASCCSNFWNVLSTNRGGVPSQYRDLGFGFRLALEVPGAGSA